MTAVERFDGCEVVKKLSTGPITDLYHVVQEPLGRPAFIKALGSSILPSSPFAASLEREARLLAELNHPNILKVYDFVRRGERMWLVLEYVDGVSLEEVMKRAKRVPEAFACAVALEVCRALAHAHAHGVVHRDVQPKNVLLGKDGSLKLANFSVAFDERMPTAPELLEGGTGYGGPSYMSPEQILGERADGRSDLFSLGVLLYEMLSGERPFDGPDDRSTSLRIRRDPVPPLSKKAPGVSQALERVTQRCLEKMPSDRFDGALEACAMLEAAAQELGAEPTAPLIRDTLIRARLVDGSPLKGTAGAQAAPERRPRGCDRRRSVRGLAGDPRRRVRDSAALGQSSGQPRWPPQAGPSAGAVADRARLLARRRSPLGARDRGRPRGGDHALCSTHPAQRG